MNKPNIVSSIIGIGLSLYVIITASKFPVMPSMKIGAGYFPVMLAIGLLVLSLALMVQTLLKKGQLDYKKLDPKSPELIRSFLSLIATITYAFMMQFIGFIVATVFYLFFLMHLLKNRNYKQMTFVSILVSIVVYLVFKKVLNLTLPTGFLI